MKAILILAGPYSSCDTTKIIWQDICLKNNIELEKYDLSDEIGKDLATKYNIVAFPAFIFNGKVVAVGHPDKSAAEKVIQALI